MPVIHNIAAVAIFVATVVSNVGVMWVNVT